ncbi:MAG: GTPase HflX, partial [Anaerolineae bacterium]|nr:GTPase HflX [Anaerolineae bacterium]
LQAIEEVLSSRLRRVQLLLPYERGDIVSLLFQQAHVNNQEHTPEGILIDVELSNEMYERYKDYEHLEFM